jgi:DNA-binding MarR family transcriptional regulator
MTEEFARLYSLLSLLFNKYGLTELEKNERKIFDFIATSQAYGHIPTTNDVVRAAITTRSSTYRHITNLQRKGLLNKSPGHNSPLLISDKMNGFIESYGELKNECD